MAQYGLSNEFVVSINELFNEGLYNVARPNVLPLCLCGVNNYGRQNGASFDFLIEKREC